MMTDSDTTTPDARTLIIAWAIEAAHDAPLAPQSHAHTAKVDWRIITGLRDALAAAGIDWQAGHADHQQHKADAHAAAVTAQIDRRRTGATTR